MADDTIASIVALHQPKRARTGAQRPVANRPRKRRKAKVAKSESSESVIAVDFSSRDSAPAESLVTPPSSHVLPVGRSIASLALAAAAFTLAAVGLTTNGWFARSLGSSDIAGWLFLAMGVAADLAALVTPICAARLWHIGQRAASFAGWAVLGDDLCLCGHRRDRLCFSQHRRCYDCAGIARNICGDSGSICIERRDVGA